MAYSTESLTNGIEACKKNIKTFEDAIQKERDTIQEYHAMIETIQDGERKAKAKAAIESNFKRAVRTSVTREADKG